MISAFGIDHIAKAAPLTQSAFNPNSTHLSGLTSSVQRRKNAAGAKSAAWVSRQNRPIQGGNLRGAGYRHSARSYTRELAQMDTNRVMGPSRPIQRYGYEGGKTALRGGTGRLVQAGNLARHLRG